MNNKPLDLPTFIYNRSQHYELEEHQRIRNNLKNAVLVMGIFTVFVFLALKFFAIKDVAYLTISIFVGLMGAIVTFAFGEWNYVNRSRRIEGDYISKAVEDSVARLTAKSIYDAMMASHLSLNWKLSKIFSKIVKNTYEDGGGIVVAASPDDYLQCLSDTLSQASESYMAILRGGESEEYRPRWFFQDSNKKEIKDQDGNLKMNEDRRLYLEKVKEANHLTRLRIMIFKEITIYKDFSDKNLRKKFLDATTGPGIKLFWATPDSLKERLPEYHSYWNEDYAVVDDKLVLKHNTSSSLIFASIGIIAGYGRIFECLNNDISNNIKTRFKIVTPEIVGDCSWNEWLQSVADSANTTVAIAE